MLSHSLTRTESEHESQIASSKEFAVSQAKRSPEGEVLNSWSQQPTRSRRHDTSRWRHILPFGIPSLAPRRDSSRLHCATWVCSSPVQTIRWRYQRCTSVLARSDSKLGIEGDAHREYLHEFDHCVVLRLTKTTAEDWAVFKHTHHSPYWTVSLWMTLQGIHQKATNRRGPCLKLLIGELVRRKPRNIKCLEGPRSQTAYHPMISLFCRLQPAAGQIRITRMPKSSHILKPIDI